MIVFYDDAELLSEDVVPYTHVSETDGNIVLDPFWDGTDAELVKPAAVKSDQDICDNIEIWAKPFQHMTQYGLTGCRWMLVTKTPEDYRERAMDSNLIIIK